MTVVEETTWTCVSCTQDFTHEAEQPMASSEGEICEPCAEDRRSCDYCGTDYHMDDMTFVEVGEQWICDRHNHMVITCDDCGTTLMDSDDHGDRDISLCERCRDYYSCCDSCGDIVHDNDINYCDRYDQHHCNDCYVEDGGVNSYDYRPCFRIFGRSPQDRTTTTFGVELEVEYRNAQTAMAIDTLRKMWGNEDVTFLKSDGSLSDGVEAVSHPMTLDFARSNINRDALASLSQQGVRSWKTNTCGIHIHIGRDTFRNHSHLARFMILFTRSKEQIVKLAGRETSQWASFELNPDESMVKQADGKQLPHTRYRAINLMNRDTVEIRVFRGSLNPDTIIAHMELLSAMIEYTRQQRHIIGLSTSLTWQSFRPWLHNNKNFPAANTRCQDRVDGRI